MNPTAPLPHGWEPSLACKQDLHARYGKDVDLGLALRKFIAYNQDGQTARNWEARLTAWVIGDVARVRERAKGGTDDLGVPLNQHHGTTQPLRPGDEGYVSLDDLAETARQQGLAAQEEQP